jgi:hypothetical protein
MGSQDQEKKTKKTKKTDKPAEKPPRSRNCRECGNIFEVPHGRGAIRYCSDKCRKARRKAQNDRATRKNRSKSKKRNGVASPAALETQVLEGLVTGALGALTEKQYAGYLEGPGFYSPQVPASPEQHLEARRQYLEQVEQERERREQDLADIEPAQQREREIDEMFARVFAVLEDALAAPVPPQEVEDLVTAQRVAQYLAVDVQVVEEMTERHELPVIMVAARWRYKLSRIVAHFERG